MTAQVRMPPLIASETGSLEKALVVRPSPSLERELPIQGEPSPIIDRAREQHDVFIARLHAAGVVTTTPDRVTNALPSVAIADFVLMFPDGAFLMRPTDAARRRELATVEAALTELKVPILGRIEPPGLLDAGDVIVGDRTLFIGVPHGRPSHVGIPAMPHGNALGRGQLKAFAGILSFKAVDVTMDVDVRRLRSVATLLDADTMLYAPRVLDAQAFEKFRSIEVAAGEEYGAGVLALGRRRIIANVRFKSVLPMLRKAKYSVDAIDLWEFGKVGITPSSLLIPLQRR
jgi:dimethylargininase